MSTGFRSVLLPALTCTCPFCSLGNRLTWLGLVVGVVIESSSQLQPWYPRINRRPWAMCWIAAGTPVASVRVHFSSASWCVLCAREFEPLVLRLSPSAALRPHIRSVASSAVQIEPRGTYSLTFQAHAIINQLSTAVLRVQHALFSTVYQ